LLVTKVLGVLFRKPSHEKIKPPHTALRADASTPAGPVFHKLFISDQPNNLIIGSIFQQAARCPILVQPTLPKPTLEDLKELLPAKIIIPDIRKSLWRLHPMIIRENEYEI
jgi:hypothetical protein